MKALGLAPVAVAEALGHSTTRPQRYYGGAGNASGAIAPIKTAAARTVKVKAGYVATTKARKMAPATEPTAAAAKSRRKPKT
jgi:hypothetical protein